MRTVRRLLTAAGTSVALAAAGMTVAAPAHADSCVGSPEIPQTYVCVTVHPENATFSTGTDTAILHRPTLCLLITCLPPSDTPVDVPTVTPNEGDIVEVTYMGTTYGIGVPSPAPTGGGGGGGGGLAVQILNAAGQALDTAATELAKIKVCNGC
jgi:hypothetical protein